MRHTGESHANLGTASDAVIRQQSTKRRSKINSMIALVGVIMACVGGAQTAAGQGDAEFFPLGGWNFPYSGDIRYEQYVPAELTDPSGLNQPIGQDMADDIAVRLGLDESRTFTEEQFNRLVTG